LLRIGILLDDLKVSQWISDIIGNLNRSGITLSVVLVNQAPGRSTSFKKFYYKVFRFFESKILPGKLDPFTITPLYFPDDIPVLNIRPLKSGIRAVFNDNDLSAIEKYEVDLLLRFGFGILSGRILKLPRYGVWSLHHGDIDNFRGGPPGFWEWFYKVPVTGITVQQLTEELDGGIVIAKAYTKTDFTSVRRNQTIIFFRGVQLMTDSVLALEERKQTPQIKETPSFYSSILYKDPGFVDALLSFYKLFFRAIPLAITRHFFNEQWVLFFALRNQDSLAFNFSKFHRLVPEADRSWADPFVVTIAKKHYIFIEELIFRKRKGHITCLIIDEFGRLESSLVVLERSYHLSYPFLFQEKGQWYMIPESAENRTVDLYECTSFPDTWSYKKTLLSEIESFDNTLIKRDNRYWLFSTVRKGRGASPNDDLHLFFADDLLADRWLQHEGNPVISNPASARPAGRIFNYQGLLYRPSQICIPRYGYGISINRIDECSSVAYKEFSVSNIEPKWCKGLLTTHTLNFDQFSVVADGQLKRWRWAGNGTRPPSILFILDSLSTGGAEYSTLILASFLKNKIYWRVKVLYLKKKSPSYNPSEFGLHGNTINLTNINWFVKWFSLIRYIRVWEPSIVHSVLLYSNFFARLVKLFNRKPVFIESLVNRTYDPFRFLDPKVNIRALKILRWFDGWSQGWGVDLFHAVTHDIATHFNKETRTPLDRIKVVHRGRSVDASSLTDLQLEAIRKDMGLERNTFIFLTAGRHEYQKAQLILLKAFLEFRTSYAGPSVLLIAGREGSQTTELKNFIADHSLADSVKILGHRNDLNHLFTISDVFILPSLFEGIGGVLIEAQAYGLPLICSDLPGLKEVIETNENALVVPAGNIISLSNAMLKIATQPDLRLKFSKRGRQIFSERFKEGISHNKMLSFYMDAIYDFGFRKNGKFSRSIFKK
jgi:glycosyltransferase involved in cell wall biosynthesis